VDWREFLKPTPKKTILSLLIFIFLPFFTHVEIIDNSGVFCVFGDCPPTTTVISYRSFLVAAYYGFENIKLSFLPAVGLLLSYIFSCSLIYLFYRITQKQKDMVKEILHPTKWKLIISAICWVPALMLILNNLLPSNLQQMFEVYSNLTYILIYPIHLLNSFLWLGTGILLTIFIDFSFSLYVLWADVLFFSNFLVLVEWYIISCTIIFLYNKYKMRSK
jgi:hypothetical protein